MSNEDRKIPYGKPMISKEEKEAVSEVLDNPILVHGPRSTQFEEDFANFVGAPHAISASSCTAVLHLTYMYLGVKAGDEVIVPAQTHVATAHAVELCGAKAVFVDAESRTGNIDIDQIESQINSNTKALSLVHYLGMPVDMDRINQIAKKHQLFVVEDCALALGTYYKGKHVGSESDSACFSFYPVKHMTTGEGGMITTRRSDFAERVNRLRAFGVDTNMHERKLPGVYDAPYLGINYRMNEIQSALGVVQLKRVSDFLKARKENFETLESQLKDVDEIELFESSNGDFVSSHYSFAIRIKEKWMSKRNDIIKDLKDKGVGTSVHYPKAVPHLSYYVDKYNYTIDDFPVARNISESSIALPVGPHITPEDAVYVASQVKESISKIITST